MPHVPVTVIVVMGPSGAGKTTVGRALAVALGWEFIEADDLHPPSNIAKMREGVGLTDADRAPWLAAVRAAMDEAVRQQRCAVVACSALKRAYRDVLAHRAQALRFVYLRADPALLQHRLSTRSAHFAGPQLAASQIAALEEPGPEALTLDAREPVDALVTAIRREWNL